MPPMPPGMMSGPPPGSTPQGLSSMMPSEPPPQDGLEGPPPDGGSGGGLKDVFDEIQGVLDALASILPDQSEEIDNIKTQLMEILAKAISGGASFQGRTGGEGLRSPTNPGFPV
jgi:hypothetical protein